MRKILRLRITLIFKVLKLSFNSIKQMFLSLRIVSIDIETIKMQESHCCHGYLGNSHTLECFIKFRGQKMCQCFESPSSV